MADMRNEDRACFPKGEQKAFMKSVLKHVPVQAAALLCRVSARSIRDWHREQFSMPHAAMHTLAKAAAVPLPKNVTRKDRYWYTAIGAKRGGRAVIKKYGCIGGDPAYRKRKWREWWEHDGKHRTDSICVAHDVITPHKSKHLAEFVGIMLGDGGITQRQVTITLNRVDDAAYADFVAHLIKELFQIAPSVYNDKHSRATTLVISRSKLVAFCQSIGLVLGDKITNNATVPAWVMRRKAYRIACLRGLMDTDGCVFQECHTVNNKCYCYPRMHFVSATPALLTATHVILTELDMSARKRHRRISLEKRADIVRYFNVVGSSNAKHRTRFAEYIGGNPAG